MIIFVKAFFIGFLFAIPPGPIGGLVIGRALAKSKRSGIFTALGSVSADAFFSAVGIIGTSLLSGYILLFQKPLQVIGGTILLFVGVMIMCSSGKIEHVSFGNAKSNFIDFLSGFLINISNVSLVLAYIGVFTIFNMRADNVFSMLGVSASVFLGSILWFLILVYVIGLLKSRLRDKVLLWVRRFIGLMVLVSGIIMILNRDSSLLEKAVYFFEK